MFWEELSFDTTETTLKTKKLWGDTQRQTYKL
jgi:hypothetical protein